MFELQEPSTLSYLKQLIPIYRFGMVAETTIDKIHPSPSDFPKDSIKVLSWNIAKNNQARQWRKDLSLLTAITKSY
ncbi:MAG: hypothetical protein QNJ18_15130 [Xenococcaceae cyanobacterium MO_167.B52]|nr:hypothetical protein [Xenococcaceae cyanobacterium MO_167.B52]